MSFLKLYMAYPNFYFIFINGKMCQLFLTFQYLLLKENFRRAVWCGKKLISLAPKNVCQCFIIFIYVWGMRLPKTALGLQLGVGLNCHKLFVLIRQTIDGSSIRNKMYCYGWGTFLRVNKWIKHIFILHNHMSVVKTVSS